VDEFRQLVRLVAATRPEWIVEPCFLELAEPDVATGLDRAVAHGAETVVALPLLLFAAGHAKRDVPELLDAARKRHPAVRFVQAAHLGCHPQVVELSVARYRAAAQEMRPEQTLLLLIGRGSYDLAANAEMAQFARLRFEAAPVGWYEVAFTAMASPLTDRAIPVVAALPFEHVVVQPHSLFAGELMERLRSLVMAATEQYPMKQWSIVESLGPDPLLVRAVLERADAALLT
jgi:sirohydrochlorin cobaltochelatase